MADTTLPAWMQQLQGDGSYISDGQGGYYGRMGGGISTNPVTGESSGDPGYSYYHIAGDGNSPGQQYTIFNKDGSKQGNYTTSVDKSGFGTFAKNLAMVVGAVYGAGAMGAGAGAGADAASTAGGIDSANGVLNGAVMNGGADAGAGGLGIGGGGLSAGGAGGGSGLETMGAFPQVSTIPASTFPSVSTLGAGSGLASILPAGLSQYLGPAAALMGAVAGSQPVKQQQNNTTSRDPRVAPYLFGDGSTGGSNPGLLGYTAQQLATDQSPQAQAQLQQMKTAGLGLLNAPVAGNGFAQFTKGRY
jgi:hypothetical protein